IESMVGLLLGDQNRIRGMPLPSRETQDLLQIVFFESNEKAETLQGLESIRLGGQLDIRNRFSREGSERIGELPPGRKAFFRILRGGTREYRVESFRHTRAPRTGKLRLGAQDLLYDSVMCGCGKRQCAGQHLVQHHAQREHVAARTQRFPLYLLR